MWYYLFEAEQQDSEAPDGNRPRRVRDECSGSHALLHPIQLSHVPGGRYYPQQGASRSRLAQGYCPSHLENVESITKVFKANREKLIEVSL